MRMFDRCHLCIISRYHAQPALVPAAVMAYYHREVPTEVGITDRYYLFIYICLSLLVVVLL